MIEARCRTWHPLGTSYIHSESIPSPYRAPSSASCCGSARCLREFWEFWKFWRFVCPQSQNVAWATFWEFGAGRRQPTIFGQGVHEGFQ